MTQILPPHESALMKAADLIQRGELIGMPTETVYGLAGDALNPQALDRIFKAKERPTFDPLIVHVSPKLLSSTGQGDPLEALVALGLIDISRMEPETRRIARELITNFWPGPLTLLLPRSGQVPDLVTSGLPHIGLRMPRHPVAQSLIDASQRPLAAPSANRFGRISPTQAEHVRSELEGRLKMILDGGPCEVGLESTVISLDPLMLLRPGGVPLQNIESALGSHIPSASSPHAALSEQAQQSPGLLASHYAPKKRLTLVDHLPSTPERPGVGALAWSLASIGLAKPYARIETLCSGAGNAEQQCSEAAHQLFAALRALDDDMGVAEIIAERCPYSEGMGHAINDRLNRAAGPK